MIGLVIVKVPPFVNAIVPEPVVVVTAPLSVKAPAVVKAIGPATAMLEFAEMLAALLTVNAVKDVANPTDPCKLTVPVPAARVIANGPWINEEKVILPAPELVFKEASPLSVTAEAKLMLSFVVVIDPPKETAPAPLCVKAPSKETVMLLARVS